MPPVLQSGHYPE
uniref:Uncharacterized protein n=1 Tax=Anguilla anguilla TaxID=7936 RepID=A0A0E9TKH2_ANGAN